MKQQDAPSIGVIGGGPVGSLLALGCSRLGYRVSLYDPAPLGKEGFENPQARTLVLNRFTIDLLASMGIELERLPDVTPVRTIKLRQYANLFGSAFDKRHRRGDCFGLALPQTSLQAALNRAIREVDKHSLAIDDIGYEADGSIVCSGAGKAYHHQLMLVADGGGSDALKILGVANPRGVVTQQAHVGELMFADSASRTAVENTAFEVFDLRTNTTSVVVPQSKGATLVLLAPLDFPMPEIGWINQRLSGWLRVADYTYQATWPLAHNHAQELIRPRLAVLGNAALSMHPLAAQGLNLAYRQCAELFVCLHGATNPGDPGEWTALRRFEAKARANESQAQGLVESLRAISGNPVLLRAALALSHLPGGRGLLTRMGGGGVV